MSGIPLIDARGMRCPWPVIRLARAAREAGKGAVVRIAADDPIAPGEIAAVAEERGWRMTTIDSEIGPVFEIGT